MRYNHALSVLVLAAVSAATLPAQSPLRPAPSGRGTSEVTLRPPEGQMSEAAPSMTIRLDYGQPHLRGRTLFTDSLVPYDKPWRTGANNVTTLKTDVDLVVGGASLTKGTYVLYTLPGRAGWKLIIQKSAGQSAMQYDVANDVVRIDVRRQTLPAPLESLTMWLIPSIEAGGVARGELRMAWGTTQLSTDWSVK